jgi:hypothetical protein
VISSERGKDREVFTASGIYQWSFVTQIFHNDHPNHGGNRKVFEVVTSTYNYDNCLNGLSSSCNIWFVSIFSLKK